MSAKISLTAQENTIFNIKHLQNEVKKDMNLKTIEN